MQGGVQHFVERQLIERCFSRHDIWSTWTNGRYDTSSNHYLVEFKSKLFNNVNCKSDQMNLPVKRKLKFHFRKLRNKNENEANF